MRGARADNGCMIQPLRTPPWFMSPEPSPYTWATETATGGATGRATAPASSLPPAFAEIPPLPAGALFPLAPGGMTSGAPAAPAAPRVPSPLDAAVDAERTRVRTGPPAPAAAAAKKPLLGSHKVMAGDRALITGGITDPARVAKFRTESRIVEAGQKYLGTPYVWGGADKSGFDCSGFTHRAMKDAGCNVPLSWFRNPVDPRVDPRSAEGHGMRVVKDPRPGDVVVFGANHIGIYTGNVDGVPMYMSANHGGKWATPGNSGDARVDVMPVTSRGERPVYFRYNP